MKTFIKSTLAAACLLSPMMLQAESMGTTEQSAGLSIGTIGAQLEYSRILVPEYNIAIRVAAGGASWSGTYEDMDTEYDTDLSLFTFGTTIEYHPYQSGFYIGAGIFYQNSDYTMDAEPKNGTYTFNGHEYDADLIGGVYGDVDNLNSVVPYIGIGYDKSLYENSDDSLFFSFKLGAWYQGTPKVNLTVHDCQLGAGCTLLEEDVQQEEDDINDDIKDYKWWPVLQVGLSYRF